MSGASLNGMEGVVKNDDILQQPIPITDWEGDPLCDLLLKQKKLKETELNSILAHSKTRDGSLAFVLIRFGLVSEQDVAHGLSEITGLPVMSSEDYSQPPPVHFTISQRFLKSVHAVPVSESAKSVVVAMADPRDISTVQAFSVACAKPIEVVLGLASHIDAAIEEFFSSAQSSTDNAVDQLRQDGEDNTVALNINEDDVAHLRDLASEAPVIRLVNTLMQNAVQSRASDIHFEPFDGMLQVRYRIDGILKKIETPTTSTVGMAAAVISRIKIMAKLDIAERRLPQDGRIQLRVLGKRIDMRVATAPTIHGEGVVIRLLDNANVELDFQKLGFDADMLQQFLRVVSMPHGILLVTGPTGSGKTTTLYAALNHLNTSDRKIIAVEDPVEYQLNGINQIPVKPQIGLGFANALRSIVRQDPDVIMIGEMRDVETARIAVQSALTGHQVFSTLHTNDAASGVTRLLDMGIEDYLLTSTVNAILAQRLVRVLCTNCREPYIAPPGAVRYMSQDSEQAITLYHAHGCEHCNGTGYFGRMSVLELLPVSDAIRKLILAHADAQTIHDTAVQQGMRTMFAHGIELARSGKTTLEEVHRVTQER